MKVILIYPPDHRVPHSLYLSLPELAAVLKQAGHEPIIRDLNAETLNLLLDRNLLSGYRDYMKTAIKLFDLKEGKLSPEDAIEKKLIESCTIPNDNLVLDGEEAARIFYDRSRFYDPADYRRAMDSLGAVLSFLFDSIASPSPYLPRYLQQMDSLLSTMQDDPVSQTLRSGLVSSILSAEPDLIGITIPYQENMVEGFRVASMIRALDPSLPIVVGGPQITKYRDNLFADNTLFSYINYAVVYEGSTAIIELAEALEGKRSLSNVRNLYWSERGRVRFNGVGPPENMDDLPAPCYDNADLDQYLKPEPIFGLSTTRGCCWKRCVFCSEAFRSRFAMRSPKRVFEDMKGLVDRYGARHIFFWDSLLPPRTMRELAEMNSAEGLDVNWFADTKFYDHYSRPEYVKLLYDGGVRCLQFGLESANQRVLDLMRKGTKINKVPGMIRLIHETGIMNQISWFVGFPTETSEEFMETLRFFEKHREFIDMNVFVGSFYFEFGTHLSRHPELFDSEIKDVGGDYHLISRSGMSGEEIELHKQRYLPTSDMDLLCHGGYFLHHANGKLNPHMVSRSRGRSFLDLEG